MNANSLPPEQRQQLATLLSYCREMGGVDFYRGAGDSQPSAPEGLAVASVDVALPSPLLHAPASANPIAPPDLLPIMPAKSTLLAPPPIDFSVPGIPSEQRLAALQAIQTEIGDCTRCPLAFEGRNKIVFGDGDPNAELLFVGEGPGADEDQQGVPFVGRGGQLLNNMIAAMGLHRDRVYIANIVKCRPPKNRVPEPVEALTCTPFLFRQIGVVRPKLIVALGATAATYLTGSKAALSVLRGQVHDCMGTKLLVTYHPAYLLRDPRQKSEAWKDLQLAMRFLHLSPPKRAES
ncbi:MAG: uracil-DNA glycosylase [Acidobacteriaceae bacterium]